MVIPFFSTGQLGKSRTVTAQRHLNLYGEHTADKSKLAFYGTPGTTLRKSFGDTPIRGWIAIDSLYYVVHRGTFYSVNNAGTTVTLGTLDTTTGRVDMAYDGTLILITTGTSGYTFTISGATFAIISDADFPDAAKTCAWLAGQFIVDDGSSDVFFISPTGTAWDALDFATAESNPDGLERVYADNGEVILFGANTTEYWGNTGAADFPFQNIKGSTQEFGLAARWSVCKFNSGIAALMRPAGGQVQVMFITGYVPKPISTQEVDSLINGYTTVSDATAYSYMLGGHPMLQINFHSASKSWLYDASSGLWSPLEYGLSGARHRGELALDFLNKTIIADYSTGDIYNLEPETYTDNGTAIAREIVSRHVFSGNKRVPVSQLFVDMEVGVGLSGTPLTSGENYLNLTGGFFDCASTPDSAALGITGDIEFIAYITPIIWSGGGVIREIVAKYTTTGNQRSYRLYLDASAFLNIDTSSAGTGATEVSGQSTAAVPGAAGFGRWIKANLDVNDGGGNRVYKFYYSADSASTDVASVSWTALGATVTTAGATTIFDGTAELKCGTSGVSAALNGKIQSAYVLNGIGGSMAAAMTPNSGAVGASSFTSSETNETWTMNGPASIDGDFASYVRGCEPQVMLQISKNNGATWGTELWKNLGALGNYLQRVVWRRLGISRDWLFKLRVTDPVKVVFVFGDLGDD